MTNWPTVPPNGSHVRVWLCVTSIAEEHGEEDMPASIQSLVLARMDRLSVEDKRALQAASVIGQHFALDALCHLLGQDRYTCAGLLKHHLVRPEGDDYLFAHALIQEGVYSSLLKATRWELHVRAADWFSEHDAILRALFDERVEVSYSVGSASALFNDGSFGALSNGTI